MKDTSTKREAIEPLLAVRTVVHLACSSEVVVKRIWSDVSGDRVDDDLAAVRDKLVLYERRTAPLLEYHRRRGVCVESLEVTARLTAEGAWSILDTRA